MRNIRLGNRFFIAVAFIVLLFALSNALAISFIIACILSVILIIACIYDYTYLLRSSKNLTINRVVTEKLSLGDTQNIEYIIELKGDTNLWLELFDTLPYQLQIRERIHHQIIEPNLKYVHAYPIRPTDRGEYQFRDMIYVIKIPSLGLLEFQQNIPQSFTAKVYPSILQMKRMDLRTMQKAAHLFGLKKIRTIGQNDEFEVIRNYQQGDYYKSINWKATSRNNELMVNQYQDTRMQEVYCILDKGRTMELPFDKLSLLDYAINTSLIISNIVLQKNDRIGLITFSNKIDMFKTADSRSSQLTSILEHLYNQKTSFLEHDFELLYATLRKRVSKRSILFLYTNFEHLVELNRNIKSLELISKIHHLVVINFINTELENNSTEKRTDNVDEVYSNTIIQKMANEKKFIHTELKNRGISSILIRPEQLSIAVINKYLEIKAKRI